MENDIEELVDPIYGKSQNPKKNIFESFGIELSGCCRALVRTAESEEEVIIRYCTKCGRPYHKKRESKPLN